MASSHLKRRLSSNWTLLAVAPKTCMVQLRDRDPAIVAVSAAVPSADTEQFVLAHGDDVAKNLPDLSTAALNVYAKARDGRSAVSVFQIADTLVEPVTISGTPPAATIGQAYSFTPTTANGQGTKTYALAGTLPAGLSFNPATGAITGTPTVYGSYQDLALTVSDQSGAATLNFSLFVGPAAALAISGTPGDAAAGQPYSFTPTVTGGYGTRRFSIRGSLPYGLNFNSATGAITGTPAAAGRKDDIEITVSDDTGVSRTLAGLSISVIVSTVNLRSVSIVPIASGAPTGSALWSSPRYGDVFEASVDADGLSADVYPIYSWRSGVQGTAPQSRASRGEFEKRFTANDDFNGLTCQVTVSLFSKSQNKVVAGPVHSVESGIFSGAVTLWDGFDGPLSEYAIGSAVANAAILTSGQDQGTGMLHFEGNGAPSVTPQVTKNTALNIDPSAAKTIMLAMDLQSEKSQNQVALAFGRSGTFQFFSPTTLGNGWPTGKRVVGMSQAEWNFPASHKGVAATVFRTNLSSQQSPYNTRLNFDALMAAATGSWLFTIGFDDGFRDAYDIALPILKERGLVGQVYLPCGPAGRIADDEQGEARIGNKLLVSEVRALLAAGWGIGMDGTVDDLPMTGKTMADVKAGIDAMRAWLIAKGFPADHTADICYPNGYYRGDANGSLPAAIAAPIMVTDGSAVVRFRDAANANDVTLNVPNGYKCRGLNIPDGVTVQLGGGSAVSTVTLSQGIPAQAKAADFIDASLTYYPPAMRNFLRDQCGIKSARTTEQALYFTRGGPGDLALNHPGLTTSGKNYSDLTTYFDNLESGGLTGEMYIHQLTDTPSGGINHNVDQFKLTCDRLANGQAQGKGRVVTKPRLRALHWAGTVAKMLAA